MILEVFLLFKHQVRQTRLEEAIPKERLKFRDKSGIMK